MLGLDKKRLDFFIGAPAGKEEDLTNRTSSSFPAPSRTRVIEGANLERAEL